MLRPPSHVLGRPESEHDKNVPAALASPRTPPTLGRFSEEAKETDQAGNGMP